MRSRLLLLACLLAPACGGDDAPAGDDDPGDPDAAGDEVPPDAEGPTPDAAVCPALTGSLQEQIGQLPHVVSVTPVGSVDPDHDCFRVIWDQPVDHGEPDGASFDLSTTLCHRDAAAPMVVLSTGYSNFYGSFPTELTQILDANQISLEHRYFGASIPDVPDWSQLTIENAAGDTHRIVASLECLYPDSAFLSTGASKGGMTSSYHRRFYPADMDGTVPYVAPLSFAAPDPRYDSFIAQIGPSECRQALQDLQVEMLRDRRAAFEAFAADEGESYERISLAAAVEGAIVDLYWVFWQYEGVGACSSIPSTSASDATLWSYLDNVSPVSGYADDGLVPFAAYYYQAAYELGYPWPVYEYLEPHMLYDEADYDGIYPEGVGRPQHRPAAMADIDDWVQSEGSQLLFIYGEWDPWTGGAYTLGGATDSLLLTAPQATHGAGIEDLSAGDEAAALARLSAWSGVSLAPGALPRVRLAEPRLRVPPVMTARRP